MADQLCLDLDWQYDDPYKRPRTEAEWRHLADTCEERHAAGCIDCHWTGDYYMVRDEVWRKAGLDEELCCLRCLEIRIGRKLNLWDFTAVPANELVFELYPYLTDFREMEAEG